MTLAEGAVRRRVEQTLNVGTTVLIFVLATNAQFALTFINSTPAYELAAVLVLGRVALLAPRRAGLRDQLGRSRAVLAAVALFGGYGLLRIFGGSVGSFASNPSSIPELWVKDMLVVAAVLLGATSIRRIRDMSWLMVLSLFVLAGPALVQHLTGTYSVDWFGLARNESGFIDGVERVQVGGPLGSANPLAQWLLTALPIALHFAVAGATGGRRLVASGASLLAVSGVIATQSRQGLLVLIALGFLWTILYAKPQRKSLLRVGGAIAALVLVVVAVNPTRWARQVERLGEVAALVGADIDPESSAAGYAGTFWAGYDMFVDHPLLGVGHGNFTERYPAYVLERGIDGSGKARAAHNGVIHLLAETGFIGAALFGAALSLVVFSLFRARSRLRAYELQGDAQLATALVVSLGAWVSSSMFQGLFHTEQLAVVLGLAMGLVFAANGLEPSRAVGDRVLVGYSSEA